MATKNKQVDEYIAKAKPFAKPILNHLRKLIHEACPDVEEKMKWSFPCFDYKGPFINIAGFNEHCVFGFWKASLLNDPKGYLKERANQGGESMGHLGRILSLKDLPPDKVIIDFIRQAKKLNDEGIKVPKKPKIGEPKEITVPDYFQKVLNKNKAALKTFEGFSPSNRKEYLQWITEAKTEETRNKRMETAIEWLAEGKIRNWKYLKK
jgi:uncharacterized protein YdeI (YjbR/CyaY-like superfamily)